MKQIIEFKGHTITTRNDHNTALVFSGVRLTNEQLNNLPKKCIAGDTKCTNGKWSHNAIDKAKLYITSLN